MCVSQEQILFAVGKRPDELLMLDSAIQTLEQYLELVAQTGAFAGSLEAAAMATTMDRPMSYMSKDRYRLSIPKGGAKSIESFSHSLRLKDGKPRVLPGQTVGGGKSNLLSCWPPNAKGSLGGHTDESAVDTGSLGGKTAQTKRPNVSSDKESKESENHRGKRCSTSLGRWMICWIWINN